MNDGLNRRWPALLTLGLMLLLAGGSFWLLKKFQAPDDVARTQGRADEPDYTMDNFRYVNVAPDGKVSYLLVGERLLHYPDSNDSVIRHPLLTSYYPDRPPMTVRSEKARVNADHSEVHLHDKVVLRRPEPKGDDELTVESEYMLVLTKQDLVKSDRPVHGRQGHSTLNGTGMLADNARRTLALHHQVTATFVQPRQTKQ